MLLHLLKMSARKNKPEIVDCVIRKHEVVITNKMVVHIHHKNTCSKPCDQTEKIKNYLEAELFVNEGYIVSEVPDSE